jgi:hypothetical protein
VKRAVVIAALLANVPLAEARLHQDGYDTPTETHVELVAGLWHDDKLTPDHGWNHYAFVAVTSGYVAVQMRAPRDHATLWSYLRVIDGDHNWAAVANRETNLCEVIVAVVAGHRYDIIATSQRNATLSLGERQITDGPYTIGVVPVGLPVAP